MKKLNLAIVISLVLFALAGCTITKMTDVWQNDAVISDRKYDKVMAICITRTMVIRRQVEDEFVKRLQARGTDAVPSYTLIPDHNDLKKQTVIDRIQGKGIDAVLVTSLFDSQSTEHVAPSGADPGGFYGNLYEYSNRRLGSGSSYTYEEKKVMLETNVYDTKTEALVWSGESETNLKASNAVRSYTSAAIKSMTASGLFN